MLVVAVVPYAIALAEDHQPVIDERIGHQRRPEMAPPSYPAICNVDPIEIAGVVPDVDGRADDGRARREAAARFGAPRDPQTTGQRRVVAAVQPKLRPLRS